MNSVELLTIGEAARRAGMRTSALRYYERVGLLEPPARIAGRRRYQASVLQRLGLIRLAQDAGFSINEIRTLLLGFVPATPASGRWQSLARHKLVEVDALIERAVRMRALLGELLACECVELEQCSAISIKVRPDINAKTHRTQGRKGTLL